MRAKPAKKLIHFDPDDAGRLVCDNSGCGYVAPHQKFGPHLIGTPCPECGSDLLTREDYNAAARMMRVVDWINRWFGWLGNVDQKSGHRVEVQARARSVSIEGKGRVGSAKTREI
ncbi:hypothetical protein SAMN05216548_11476 [Faunimonas pinastri]|uniref:Uncharacterized protein n=1 Tax=Faunimonas pinastri TaxID=1855383 RepID=A0A1H9MXS6_9HYPH|nr:hypothetical protein [Faunimonas pinastri]SER27903.1 hypothetical protein SAMN05216548_11476 [Faunimonas pinastri]